MVSGRVVQVIGIILILYSLIQISLFMISFAQNMDPDWIVLLKVMYNFIILPSAIQLIIAVSKDNMTIATISEVMLVSALLGFLLYSLLLLITFVQENEYGLPFAIFLVHRLLFLFALLVALCTTDKYRRRRLELIRHDRWSNASTKKSSKVTSDCEFVRTIEHSSTTTELDPPTITGEGDLLLRGLPMPMGGGVCGLPQGFPPPPNINPKREKMLKMLKREKRKKKYFKFYDDPPPDPPTIYIGPPLPPNPPMGGQMGCHTGGLMGGPMGGQMSTMGQLPMLPMAPHPVLPMPPGTQFPMPYTQRAELPIGCMGMPPPMGQPLSQPYMPFSNPFGQPVALPPQPGGCCG